MEYWNHISSSLILSGVDGKAENNKRIVSSLGCLSDNLSDSTECFYLTTAIAYTNGFPHIGHAYEFLTSDIIARYHRLFGKKVFFLTGSDEHGQKVANSAATAGRTPIDHCNIFVDAFQKLNSRLAVSCTKYIRTTDSDHELTAQELWKKCFEQDDIYLSKYEGWYNEREETFVSDADAECTNFLDPGNGIPLKKVTEESYFFRMSKFTQPLIEYIESNTSFIEPDQHRNSILIRLKKEGLRDLSISRTSFTWGIKVPEGFDTNHVMYVWFDALSNYLSGIKALDSSSPLAEFWPANMHIIGKDIIWFHCVIWPCMLMSAKLPLPAQVFAHGFVNAADGRKMSKSYNNAIDPNEMLQKYPLDALRYYVCSSTTYGQDLNFSEASLVTMLNSELADILGNLIHRILNLTLKYCDGVVPDCPHDPSFPPPFDLTSLIQECSESLKSRAIHVLLFKAMEATRATNRFLSEAEPWKMKGPVDELRRPSVVRTTLEAVYVFSHFLAPVIPMATQTIFGRLNTEPRIVSKLNPNFYNLCPGTKIGLGEILFQKIEVA